MTVAMYFVAGMLAFCMGMLAFRFCVRVIRALADEGRVYVRTYRVAEGHVIRAGQLVQLNADGTVGPVE